LTTTSFRKSLAGWVAAAILGTVAGIATPAAAINDCGAVYTVNSGDTFSRIARRCDVTVEALAAANADLRDPSRIAIGQRLAMPGQVGKSEAKLALDQMARLSGEVVSGRRCALLETADGQVYGLRSSKLIFVSGRDVVATGRVRDRGDCGVDKTLVVHQLETLKK